MAFRLSALLGKALIFCASLLSTLIAITITEWLALRAFSQAERKEPALSRFNFLGEKTLLPAASIPHIAFYGPAFAAAVLLPIYAGIPNLTLLPTLKNGGDIVQILQFAALADAVVIFTVLSLGSDSSDKAALRIGRESLQLFIPLVGCYASFAFCLTKMEVSDDPCNIATLLNGFFFDRLGTGGITACVIFALLIMISIPHSAKTLACITLDDEEIADYRGPSRVMLRLCAVLKAFIVIALIVNTFMPWSLINMTSLATLDTWMFNAVNFLLFWVTVISMRLFVLPLCWTLLNALHKKIPAVCTFPAVVVLTLLAMLLIFFEDVAIL